MIWRFCNIDDNHLVTQATLLDPRFKKQAFSSETKSINAIYYIWAKVQSITLEVEQNEPQQSPSTSSSTTRNTLRSILLGEFDESVVNLIGESNPSVAGIVEVDKYLNEPLRNRFENPLAWWVERKKVYPRKYELVKKRLCIVANSVPSESFFKSGPSSHGKKSRLSFSKISQILFLDHNM